MRQLKSAEEAFILPEWFKKMSVPAQKKYLKEHKNSKLARGYRQAKESDRVNKTRKPAKRSAQSILKDSGSPTGFKGPKDDASSMSGNAKAERHIVTQLEKLAQIADKARKEGKEVPDYDLCKAQIPGTNLFCEVNLGVPRKNMPQLKGIPAPGTWADKNLEKNDKGEVDAESAFRKMLENKNISTEVKNFPASQLKSTQTQLVGSKVAGMTEALKKDPSHAGITAPIYVSRDGYILDGHHRWAAQVALDMADGIKEPIVMKTEMVDMDMKDLLDMTNEFTQEIGIAAKAGKAKEHSYLVTRSDLNKLTASLQSEKTEVANSQVWVELYKLGNNGKLAPVTGAEGTFSIDARYSRQRLAIEAWHKVKNRRGVDAFSIHYGEPRNRKAPTELYAMGGVGSSKEIPKPNANKFSPTYTPLEIIKVNSRLEIVG